MSSSNYLNILQFVGPFAGKENVIRKTTSKVSVIDIISVVGGQKNPHDTWTRLKNAYPEVLAFCEDFKFRGRGQPMTPVVDAKGVVFLLNHIPGDLAKQFRAASAGILVRHLGGFNCSGFKY
jgi:hypothetical protein